jgi:hypothetical protein
MAGCVLFVAVIAGRVDGIAAARGGCHRNSPSGQATLRDSLRASVGHT